jgi:hypothetical protein
LVENPYDKKSKKKAQAGSTSTISYNIRDTTPTLSGIGGATVTFDARMEDITPLQLPSQMPESSSDESEDDISIQEEPNFQKKPKKSKKLTVKNDGRKQAARQEKKEVSTGMNPQQLFLR